MITRKLYRVDDDGSRDGCPEGESTATWRTSLKAAREAARERQAWLQPDETVTIERVIVGGDTVTDLIVSCLNEVQYVVSREEVERRSGLAKPELCVECGELPVYKQDLAEPLNLCIECVGR